MSPLARLQETVSQLLRGGSGASVRVLDSGPEGEIAVPSAGDGTWHLEQAGGRPCLAPDEASYYLYFVIPEAIRRRAKGGAWLEVSYYGEGFGRFRVQYVSTDGSAQPLSGLYKSAEQRWEGSTAGEKRWRRALFSMPDFDPEASQNHGASLRLEFRSEMLISGATFSPKEPKGSFPDVAPTPDLRKMPGRFYPINYLFLEITNACNFKCTWCPDDIMDRRRGFMTKESAYRILDEVAEKRAWLGPLFPVKLHQMGEPMLHPDLVAIVSHAEARGVPVELNTNCGLIREDLIDALYAAGLTNLILSYQTPDSRSFVTRKAPRIGFDEYRDKVRLAVERKVASSARTHIEIDIMNTKHADGYTIVSEDEQAVAFLEDWISFCRTLEARYGLVPRGHAMDRVRSQHFLDQDENGSRYTLLDGVDLIWKRCHTWGNVVGGHKVAEIVDTYCPAPYDQFVIQWNGDVVSCCTDYEGRTKTANVFAESIESVWTGEVAKKRKKDMLAGRLLDVCATCQGVK